MPDVHSIITTVLAGGAHLLEIGCGTGAIARVLAASPGVGEVLGVDPSPILLTRAHELSEGIAITTGPGPTRGGSPLR